MYTSYNYSLWQLIWCVYVLTCSQWFVPVFLQLQGHQGSHRVEICRPALCPVEISDSTFSFQPFQPGRNWRVGAGISESVAALYRNTAVCGFVLRYLLGQQNREFGCISCITGLDERHAEGSELCAGFHSRICVRPWVHAAGCASLVT